MPRRNKKGTKGRGGDSFSEDESEIASVYSSRSDSLSSSANDSEQNCAMERYEEKFLKALEDVTEKSAQVRVAALQKLCEILMHRCIPELIDDRKVTLMDCIAKSIRRGKENEQAWAARLAPLIILQIGSDESVTKEMSETLLMGLNSTCNSFDVRAKCCTALAILNFIGCNDCEKFVTLMQVFEGIFSDSYLRSNEKTPVSISPEAAALHAKALSAWGLLLTVLPAKDFVRGITKKKIFPPIDKFQGLLQSVHLEVRIAAGEVISLIFETGREYDEDFLEDSLPDLIAIVKQLSIESKKYHAKRDRKAQRATFRDVLRYVEDVTSPDIDVRFGRERLSLTSWTRHHRYNFLRSAVGPGMTSHLQDNEFIRDIFDLGPRVDLNPTNLEYKNSIKARTKLERNYANWVSSKTRSINRSHNRDKRTFDLTTFVNA